MAVPCWLALAPRSGKAEDYGLRVLVKKVPEWLGSEAFKLWDQTG